MRLNKAEQLAKLQESVETWNAWREEGPKGYIDLTGANLTKANLTNANLTNACLYGANLNGADLALADLTGANLTGANLTKANLRHANLTNASLTNACLYDADLTGADLTGADPRHANLTNANLTNACLTNACLYDADLNGADLSDADLTNANLYEAGLALADLTGANLTNANLTDANLTGANLTNANLTHANLTNANLYEAGLNFADLRGADLNGASLHETIFACTDLTNSKGLEACRHDGPSILDHRTFERSGTLPLTFLRGCGLPDTLIDYLPSLLNQPIQRYSCFISYSTQDEEFAQRLHADLQNKGVRCWFAPKDMAGGKKIHHQIDEAIRIYDKLLLVLSEHSMKSRWVGDEIRRARKREERQGTQMLFPVGLVDFETLRDWELFDADAGTDSAAEIRQYYIPDFSNWKEHDAYQRVLERLLKDLQPSRAAEP